MGSDTLEIIGNEFDRFGGQERGFLFVEHVLEIQLNFLPENRYSLPFLWTLDQNKDGKFQLADFVEYKSKFDSQMCLPSKMNDQMLGKNEIAFYESLHAQGVEEVSEWILKLLRSTNYVNRSSIDIVYKLLGSPPDITSFEFFQQLQRIETREMHFQDPQMKECVHARVLLDIVFPETLRKYYNRMKQCLP